MIDEDEAQDAGNSYTPKPLKVRDPLHDLQLLHDLTLINARAQREQGPLPASGLPEEPQRKPHLPRREVPASIALSQTEDESMRLRHIAAVSALAAATLACEPKTQAIASSSMISNAEKPVVEYKQNPHPKQRHDITMTIADAPGPFASMEGLMQYDVVNQECLSPPDSNPGGGSAHLTRHIPFALTKVSETEYTGTIYADLMLDEEYHGRGVCHWQLIQARVHMKATGAKEETLFIPNLSAEPLLAGEAGTTYFWKGYYPRAKTEGFPESGDSDLTNVPIDRRDEFFTITMASKRMTP